MIHPVKEWREDPMQAGIILSSLIEAAAVISFLPASFIELHTWQLIPPFILGLLGIGVVMIAAIHGRQQEEK